MRRFRWALSAALSILTLAPVPLSATLPDTSPRLLSGHNSEILTMAYSPTGHLLATAGIDQTIRLWNPESGRDQKVLRGHMGAVHALAFSPNGKFLASGSADTSIRLWDVDSGQPVHAVTSNFGAVRAVTFSADGKMLATGGNDGSLRFWDAASGKEIRSVRGQFGIVYSIAFSPDGTTVATGSSDMRVHLWDLATGRQRSLLTGHTGAVYGVAFAPGGRLLASASGDGSVRIWNAETDQEQLTLLGHKGEVHAIAFSPDGRSLISAGADGSVRVWDIGSGHERYQLTGHKGAVRALAISPDGLVVASGGRDKTARLQPSVSAAVNALLADKIKQRGNETGASPSPPPLPEAELAIRPVELKAGQPVTLTLNVTNRGKGPLYRFQARTQSDDPALNGILFYLGKLDGGESAADSVTLPLPADRPDGTVPLSLLFEEYNGFVPAPLQAALTITGLPRPRFAFTHQVLDDGSEESVGNGDGRIQKGEAVDVLLTVKNVGAVPAQQTTVDVNLSSSNDVRLSHSVIDFGSLKPDETKTARVNLFVSRNTTLDDIPLRLLIRERGMNVTLDETVTLAIDHRAAPQIMATNKLVAVGEASAKIHSGAGAETSVIASAGKDQALAVTGELGDWLRVQMTDKEAGWIAKRDVRDTAQPAKGEMPVPVIAGAPVMKLFQNAPPVIALASPSDGAEVTADRILLAGAAASERGIARVEIRVNGQLLTHREARGIAVRPDAPASQPNLEFSERLTLKEGKNDILVSAIDRDNLSTQRTITVMRNMDRGKVWAVVIGISKYKTVHPLRYADLDALAFNEYLTRNVGVPPAQITLLLNEQATLTSLKRTLGTELKRKAAEKDTVIIYYAGHGAPEADASASDDDGLEKYIVPYDADPKDLYTTGLPMREVETIFNRLAPERVIFISDSCYSGATAGRTFATASRRAIVSDTFLNRLSKGKGRIVLSASKASEVSEEREDLGHGVFTYYLLEGLRGSADTDQDGIVTVDEAYSYVSKKVPDVTGQNQHPIKKGEVEGQLVLGQVR